MIYKLPFLIIVLLSISLGIILSILSNLKILKDLQEGTYDNSKQNITNATIESSNKTSDTEDNSNDINKNKTEEDGKNKMIDKNDFLNEDTSDNNVSDNYTSDYNSSKKNTSENKIINETDSKVVKDKDEINSDISKNDDKSIMKKRVIPIVINLDDNYIYPVIVFLTSLLENKKNETKYEIYSIYKELAQENKNKLLSLIKKYGSDNLNLTLVNVIVNFTKAYYDKHVSQAAYYRITIPSLFPLHDKIIYSDCDTVNMGDLTEFYDLELKDNIYYRGFLDYFFLVNTLKPYGIHTNKYMNSGILLINSKAIRRDKIEEKIIDFVNTHSHLPHYDQTAINAICYNNFEKLPIKFATFNFRDYNAIKHYNSEQDKRYRYSDHEIFEAFYHPVMFHYAGWEKPWIKNKICYYREYWWLYAKKTDYYQQILNKYGYTDAEVVKMIASIPKLKLKKLLRH